MLARAMSNDQTWCIGTWRGLPARHDQAHVPFICVYGSFARRVVLVTMTAFFIFCKNKNRGNEIPESEER